VTDKYFLLNRIEELTQEVDEWRFRWDALKERIPMIPENMWIMKIMKKLEDQNG